MRPSAGLVHEEDGRVQSLQEYLLARLIEEAETPTLDEILDRAGGRAGGRVPISDAVAALDDDRARR